MAKIYWLHGQPGSGKTTIAKRLQFWLQTDKANWRKSVFHIDEADVKTLYESKNELEVILTLSKFLLSTNHDVVVSASTPSKKFRNKLKDETKAIEIYCHSRSKSTKNNSVILEYELPDQSFVDLDTTGELDSSFEKLIKMIV